jgi:hypothetical protein
VTVSRKKFGVCPDNPGDRNISPPSFEDWDGSAITNVVINCHNGYTNSLIADLGSRKVGIKVVDAQVA